MDDDDFEVFKDRGLLRRVSNGTTSESDSTLIVSICFAVFIVGVILGILIIGVT